MKKFLAVCSLLLMLSLTACDQSNIDRPTPDTEGSVSAENKVGDNTQEKNEDNIGDETKLKPLKGAEEEKYKFLSQDAKNAWEADLCAVLSKTEISEPEKGIPGSFAAGLMDINFDSRPEVICAWPGGSMGNVYLEIYDMKSGNSLFSFNAAHCGKGDDVCIYVAEASGEYLLLAQGYIRDPECGWVSLVDKLSNRLESNDGYLIKENLFAIGESANTENDGPYFIGGKGVEESVFDEKYQSFYRDTEAIRSTEMQLIKWSDLENDGSEAIQVKMAKALINTTQSFIDFGEPSDRPVYSDWRTAYIDVIESRGDEVLSYALVYIDGDDIPELYMEGASEATGDSVYTYKYGVVTEQSLGRCGGGKYIERSGKLINQNGHMGHYYDIVYRLDENGFAIIFKGDEIEKAEHIGDEQYNIISEYTVDGVSVSKEEYESALSEAFDLSLAVSFTDISVSYGELTTEITGGK